MANSIILEKRLQIDASLTTALIKALVQNGSALATTKREEALVAYLARREQGTSASWGFCMNKMPWNEDHFEAEKEFMQRVADGAIAKCNPSLLGDNPHDDLLIESLKSFKRLLSMLSADEILQELPGDTQNCISMKKDLHMSNGATDVFMSVLVLSGSVLARTEQQRMLVAFLAGRDQSRFGIGNVGFCVNQMPWDRKHLEADKAFLQHVVDGALAKTNWHLLDYEPREDWTFERLMKFKDVLSLLADDDVQEEMAWPKPEEAIKTCEKHQTIMHYYGCYFCNLLDPLDKP